MPPPSNPTKRRVLVIAGSDSSGGAGIEADQRVLALHHCYALTAITALTAQTTTGISSIHTIPADFITETINGIWNDIGVDVVKIGMLSSAATAHAISSLLRIRRESAGPFPIVLDPVMKATSGALLVPEDAIAVIRDTLLPLASIVTPNIPEAMALASWPSDHTPKNITELTALAKQVWSLSGQGWVLLKGGHLATSSSSSSNEQDARGQSVVRDVLVDGKREMVFERAAVQTRNTHGTGCSLASAIAAGLAYGLDMPEAVERACGYVAKGIESAVDWDLGRGSGPIDHWAGRRWEGE